MTPQMILALIGGAGFLAGVAALLTFFNTRKSTKDKSSADAYLAWRGFMGGAVEDATKIADGYKDERDAGRIIRGMLISLCQAMLESLKSLKAPGGMIDSYQQRLDDIRNQ